MKNPSQTDRKGGVLARVNFEDVDLRLEILAGADLRGSDLSGTNLYCADLERAKLAGTKLAGANLVSAKLMDADFEGGSLVGANLVSANLRRANLRYTYLIQADLRCSDLREADLVYSYLTYAKLEGADVRGAKLPSPSMMLLADWGKLSDETTLALMRLNASGHPNPGIFDTWTEWRGLSPYDEEMGAERVAHFQEKRKLWSPGPAPTLYEAMCMVLDEKCIWR